MPPHPVTDAASAFASDDLDDLRAFGTELLGFLEQHRFLHRNRFTEFFTEGCGAAIPDAWMAYLSGLPEESLRMCVTGAVPAEEEGVPGCPDDLREFLSRCIRYRLRRDDSGALPSGSAVSRRCEGVLKRNLSLKKQHEVERMAALIDSLPSLSPSPGTLEAADTSADPSAPSPDGDGERKDCAAPCVIDVGSGQGYLPTMLSFGLQRRVVAIEAAEQNVEKARQREEVIGRARQVKRKRYSEAEGEGGGGAAQPPPPLVSYIPAYLSADTSDASLGDLLQSCGITASQQSQGLCLAGLHACGDLTPLLLRLFVSCRRVTSLAVVGCCYYKMGWPTPPAYPMSRFFSELPVREHLGGMASRVGPTSAQIACENSYKWHLAGDAEFGQTKRLSMNRALLEVVLHRCYPEHKETVGIKAVGRAAAKAEFPEYAQHCLGKVKVRRLDLTGLTCPADGGGFGIAEGAPPPAPAVPHPGIEELRALHAEYLPRMRELLVWLTLRECIAPAIETLFVLDRFVYLKEALRGARCTVRAIPIFSYTSSPRNIAIVAVKHPGEEEGGGGGGGGGGVA